MAHLFEILCISHSADTLGGDNVNLGGIYLLLPLYQADACLAYQS